MGRIARLILICLLVGGFIYIPCAVAGLGSETRAGRTGLPFSPGEEILYDVRWQQYRAGEASIRVLPFAQVKGAPAHHFEMVLKTNQFLDKFFKVREKIQGFVSEDFLGSVAYEYKAVGKKKKDIRLEFFPQNHTVIYSNFDEIRDPIEIPDHCFDPLSSYFKLRTLELTEGQTLSFPVTDGKKFFSQKGEIIGSEKITLKSGTNDTLVVYDTLVVVPYVTHFSGVFEKSLDPTVRVWISKDEKQIPIRIRIRVVVGSIFFDLRSYSPGAGQSIPVSGGSIPKAQ